LIIIQNAVDLVSIKYKENLNPDILDQFSKIDRTVIRMKMLINDVLNFTKTQSLTLEKNSLLEILQHSLEGIKIPKNIQLPLPDNDIKFQCDAAKLEVVFYNLITNAIQSIGETTAGNVEISWSKSDKMIQINITNSGPQIPDEVLPNIFQPLFTTKKHGTGLGLASCKHMIEQHRGTLSVRNNPTTFTVLLPKNLEKLLTIGR
jgi:signal transduction histidine kinase